MREPRVVDADYSAGESGAALRESQVTFKQLTSSSTNLDSVTSLPATHSLSGERDYAAVCAGGGISVGSRSRTTSLHLLYSRSSSVHKDLNDLWWGDDHNWLFGVTGEQEWTPEVHTGQ